MTSLTPLILKMSQFLLLSISRLLLTLWTTPPFFIGLNILSVCQEASTTWIHSYLTNRSSFVKIDSSSSSCDTSFTGVPQGSVPGPLLFVLFISPVVDVIGLIPNTRNKSGIVSFHQYADDTQLYIGANSTTFEAQIASIESCTQKVHDWLLNNGLHLNPSESEAIAFSNPRSKPLVALAESVLLITVAGSSIKLQSSI